MSQTVEIPDHGVAAFPDDMTPDQIKGVIQSKFYASPTPVATPQTGELPAPVIQSGVEAATQYGQQLGAPTVEEQKTLLSRVPEGVKAPLEAAVETAASLVPKSLEEAANLATMVSPIGPVVMEYKAAQAIREGRPLDALAGIPVAQRIPEIQAAEQTPAFSKERYKAGFGTLADILMIGGIGSQIRGGARPVPAEGVATTAPPLTETIFGKEQTPLVEAVNENLADLESRYGTPTQETPNASKIQEPTTPDGGLRTRSDVGELPQGDVEAANARLRSDQGIQAPQARQGIEAGTQASENAVAQPAAAPEVAAPIHQMSEQQYAAAVQTPNVWDSLYRYGEPQTKHPFFATDIMASDIHGTTGEHTAVHGVQFQNPLVSESRYAASEQLLGENIYSGKKVQHGVSPEAKSVLESDNKLGDAAEKAGYDAIVTPTEIQVIDKSKLPPSESVHFDEKNGYYTDAKGNVLYEGIGLKKAKERIPAAEAATTAAPLPKEVGVSGIEEPVAPNLPTGTGEAPISTKNEYTEAQRAARGLPEAEQAAKRGFGKVWDEAAAEAEKDPSIGRRLVAEINAKARPISDVENAHLLRREIEAQGEHSDAVDAVNGAGTDSDLTAAKSRLESARNDLQDVYDATKRAGTKGGQALAARKMLANEDYSLAKMEARRRAANDGEPLTEKQLAETKALNDKITDLQSKLDAHEVAATFDREFKKLVDESRKEAKSSKATGTRFMDFMDRKANEARARITERRGRLTTGFDPTAIADEAVIGASHIAKGVTKFADWSVKMAEEFGEQIRPFLKELWERSKAFHDANAKEYGDKALARYKTYLGKQTEQIKGKLEAGDFTKAQRQKTQLDKEAFTMRADLQKLKNQFERGIAKEAYKNKSPAQKFWDHFVGVERAMKLSGPEVFGKLGVAAAVREGLAPIEAAGGYGVSKVFPKFAKGTRYEAELGTVVRAEIKAKAALFTEGMKDAWQNVKGGETGLEAIGDKYGRRPEFWYNRIGKMHAAIKAPVKRAEFVRSLEKGMDVAIKNGEDINHPEVMTRLANEAVMDANRAIFQEKTVVSNFFSLLDRQIPAAGRVARFLFPVVKIPVNLFKELVNLHVGAPVGAARVGMAYWKGVETLPVLQREAIIRQLTKGSIGGAGLLWGYYNSDKVRSFFDHVPEWFNHTPMAMILNEGSYLKKLEQGGEQAKEGKKELAYMAKTDIPFMYTIKDIGDALDTHNSSALLRWINNMTQSTVVPQILTQTAKQMDKPGTFPSNFGERPTYRPAANPVEAIMAGIPGLRQTVPEKVGKPVKPPKKPL